MPTRQSSRYRNPTNPDHSTEGRGEVRLIENNTHTHTHKKKNSCKLTLSTQLNFRKDQSTAFGNKEN